MSLRVRLFEPADLPAILKLWETESGWGSITTHQWEEWYMATPWGRSIVVLVESVERGILGKVVLTPFPVRVGKRVGVGHRISAPIIHRDLRTSNILRPDHPARLLLNRAIVEAREQGSLFIYAMPLYAWRSFFQRDPQFQLQDYDCASIDLPIASPVDLPGLNIHSSEGYGAEHQLLWNDAVACLPIRNGIERSAELWRYRISGKLVLEARNDDHDLVGYLAIKPSSNLIVELVARTWVDMADVLSAGIRALSKQPQQFPHQLRSLSIMRTPQLDPHLEELGFAPVDFRFLFCVAPLIAEFTSADVMPSHWYLSAGD